MSGFLLSFLFCIRLSSVFLIKTSFVPDEYWQTVEISHSLVFGYGYVTWEWIHGIRSFIYPIILAVPLQILKILNIDTVELVILTPKILQAVITTLSDYNMINLSSKCGVRKFWMIVILCTNWFLFYCGSRTLINTFEMSLTSIALNFYPWTLLTDMKKVTRKFSKMDEWMTWNKYLLDSFVYFSIAVLICLIRPTAVTIWGPLVILHMIKVYNVCLKKLLLQILIPVSIYWLGVTIWTDSLFYKQFTFSAWNFIKLNIIQDVASLYGVHPLTWYITQGVPAILGFQLVPFVLYLVRAVFTSQDKSTKDEDKKDTEEKNIMKIIIVIIMVNILVYSLVPHKEFRFLMPILPMMLLLPARYLSNLKRVFEKTCWFLILLISFILSVWYFGTVHQAGPLSVMKFVAETSHKDQTNSYLFLTLCHSTPLYSYIHKNVTTRFLTCEPNFEHGVLDEADRFYQDPVMWLNEYWFETDGASLPTYVICYDSLLSVIESFMLDKSFAVVDRFHHTLLPEGRTGRNILVLGRV